MKWNLPKPGEVRIVKAFAWLPITAGHETRWLETVYIEIHFGRYVDSWFTEKFVDKQAYLKWLKEKESKNE